MLRNRAKCKLCNVTIETFLPNEFISCKCGEITIGPDLYAKATNFHNFLRIDDENNEKSVTYQQKEKGEDSEVNKEEQAHKLTKDELIVMLDDMIKSYENLPQHAMLAPVSHADQLSLLMLVSSLFKSI
jgi:hypothetical protein